MSRCEGFQFFYNELSGAINSSEFAEGLLTLRLTVCELANGGVHLRWRDIVAGSI